MDLIPEIGADGAAGVSDGASSESGVNDGDQNGGAPKEIVPCGTGAAEIDSDDTLLAKAAAITSGWYHPHLLTFIVFASPFARQRSNWAMVDLQEDSESPTPKKRAAFDVSAVSAAAVLAKVDKEDKSPKTKEARAAAAAAAAAAEAAKEVKRFSEDKNRRDLIEALEEAVDEEEDPVLKEELKKELKEAKKLRLEALRGAL